jgi:glutamate-ammonia-ligase adenylyltransferase
VDLVNSNFKISEDFIKLIFTSTAGYLNNSEIDNLINLFNIEIQKCYFTKSSEANLLRILNSVFDRSTFLKDCLKYPHHIEILILISSYSNFLTDVIVRNPSMLYYVFNPSNLEKDITLESIDDEIKNGITNFKSYYAKTNFLRRFKRQKLLVIGLYDILKNNDLEKTTNQISYLAKGITKHLFNLCYHEILTRKNLEIKDDKFCLAALGKLGGDELNYSSDIDLILFYDENSIHGKSPQFTYQELLTEAAQLFIKTATEVSSEGFIYRVDFRLRPDGKYAPICMSINDYFRYYENRGAEWERQMLIKLSFVAGNEMLFNSFENYLTNFVYPKTFLKSPLEQISKMKLEIEKRITDELNVKLFTGGIRDIEFTVQALQLLNGGKFKEIRTGSSIIAIKALVNNNILSRSEGKMFYESYIFLRRVEHFLQLMNNTQTHEIPKKGEITEKLAAYMNNKSINSFLSDLESKRKEVRNIFKSYTMFKKSEAKDYFSNIKFTDPQKAKRNFDYLQFGKSIFNTATFDKKTSDTFSKIKSNFISYLAKSNSPDLVLENFTKLIQASSFPFFWFNELTYKKILNDVLKVNEISKKFCDLLLQRPNLADLIFTRKVYTEDLKPILSNFEKIQIEFILTFQFALKLIDADDISTKLINYYDEKIINTINNKLKGEYFIAGLGSFGSSDISLSSDIDLIVVTADKKFNNINEKSIVKFLSEIKEALPSTEIDFKLRPEGRSSNIVWDIDAYKNYLTKRARVWEFQSLLKLRFISGNNKLFEDFKLLLVETITKSKFNFKDEIIDMHQRLLSYTSQRIGNKINLKNDFGGLTTINFYVDFLILNNIKQTNTLIGSNTKHKIEKLVLPKNNMKVLLNNFTMLKNIVAANEIISNNSKKDIPASLDNTAVYEDRLKLRIGLIEFLTSILNENKKLFEDKFK